MENHNNIKLINPFDIFLLVAISEGVTSCVFLATVTGKDKSTISRNIMRLQKNGLVDSIETHDRYFYMKYSLTAIGQKVVDLLYYDCNANLIKLLKNTA